MCFNKIYTSLYCAEQTLEVCSIELETKSTNLRILALYRGPSANFNQFIKRLDTTPKSEFSVCGDITVDYLSDKYRRKKTHY
jgi:hypothetical protein